ncbi:ABC transporter ATP-binding protein [Candidatus Woesearchaeota archaeon]|jgi:ABC-type multidrug transport system fused ATPase/permease subunit|nr:ABC transporter ATP-binding protein [Candidatus Woesearchaeota archaeon]
MKQISLLKKINILFGKSELKILGFLFLGMILTGIFEIIGIGAIMPFMAVVIDPTIIHENIYISYIYNLLSLEDQDELVLFFGLSMMAVILISNISQILINWGVIYFSNNQSYKLSVKLLNRYLEQPYSFFLNKNTSEMTKNIISEVNRSMIGVVLQALVVVSKSVIIVFICLLLAFIDPVVAVVSTGILLLSYTVIHKLVKNKVSSIGAALTTANFLLYKTADEAMSAIKYIKLRGYEKKFSNFFHTPAKEISIYDTKSSLISIFPRYILEIIVFGGMVVIVIINMRHSSHEVMSVVSLYALSGYRIMPAMQAVYSGIISIRYNLSAIDLLISDLSRKGVAINPEYNQAFVKFNKKLIIDNVCFSYTGTEQLVLDCLNVEIEKNTTVGIVGVTGSGKTTLIDILLGLLSPNDGDVIVDGVKITEHNLKDWQKNVGYVPQSIYLMDDTIKQNIVFGIADDRINHRQLRKVIEMTNLDSFISTLPKKYETFIGERGVRLSGGQQQRIGIARALYHNPEVLVLDEATSSLDNITENAIMDAIHGLSHKKTIIMIAHRLSTIKKCDVIHVINNGQVVGSGSYEYLVANNKEFRDMAATM